MLSTPRTGESVTFRERHITLTLGVTELTPARADGDEVVETADAALYVAKEGGRNRVADPRGLVERTSAS